LHPANVEIVVVQTKKKLSIVLGRSCPNNHRERKKKGLKSQQPKLHQKIYRLVQMMRTNWKDLFMLVC